MSIAPMGEVSLCNMNRYIYKRAHIQVSHVSHTQFPPVYHGRLTSVSPGVSQTKDSLATFLVIFNACIT